MSARDIFTLRKQGQHAQALEMARKEWAQCSGNADIWLLRAYAWTLFDHVKQLVADHEAGKIASTAFASRLTPLTREFARTGDPLRGDIPFSQMLRLVLKASRHWPRFLGFAYWAGVEDFSEDDRRPFVTAEGRTVDSLQQRFVRAVSRAAIEADDSAETPGHIVQWGRQVLLEALEQAPDDLWLNYYRSKLLIAQSKPDEAIAHLLPVLRRKQHDAWPWALLAEIRQAASPEDALVCWIHATQLARQEQEVAKVRIHLATALAVKGRLAEAAWEAERSRQYREDNGYRIPAALSQLLASNWFHEFAESGKMQEPARAAEAARAILRKLERPGLHYQPAVIDHVNHAKALSYVVTGLASGHVMLHKDFPNIADLPPGTIIEVGSGEADGQPRDWRTSEATEIPGLLQLFSGTLRRSAQGVFGFVEAGRVSVFVPPQLLQVLENADESVAARVTCIALRAMDKKKGRPGWRALAWHHQPRAHALSSQACDSPVAPAAGPQSSP